MKQHECRNVAAVRHKVYELTRTKPPVKTPDEKKAEREYWRDICHETRRDAEQGIRNWNSISDFAALDEDGEEIEVTVCIGYDVGNGVYLVWVEDN